MRFIYLGKNENVDLTIGEMYVEREVSVEDMDKIGDITIINCIRTNITGDISIDEFFRRLKLAYTYFSCKLAETYLETLKNLCDITWDMYTLGKEYLDIMKGGE